MCERWIFEQLFAKGEASNAWSFGEQSALLSVDKQAAPTREQLVQIRERARRKRPGTVGLQRRASALAAGHSSSEATVVGHDWPNLDALPPAVLDTLTGSEALVEVIQEFRGCPVCLAPRVDYARVWWECTLTREQRVHYGWVGEWPCLKRYEERLCYGQGLCATPLAGSPRLSSENMQPVWTLHPENGLLHGHTFVRVLGGGLWLWSTINGLRGTGSARGPLPLHAQASGAAEIFAASWALRRCMPPVVLYTDFLPLLDGWQTGIGAYAGYDDADAESWLEYWESVEDVGVYKIVIKRVSAQLPFAAIAEGKINTLERYGNRWADKEAKLGSGCHRCIQTQAKACKLIGQAASSPG